MKMAASFHILLVSIAVLCSFDPLCASVVNLDDTFKWDYLQECKQDPFELAIILDSSSSIHPRDFILAKRFLQNFLDQYTIGPQDVRVSIITFGMRVYTEDGFNLGTYTTKDDLLTAVGKVPFRAGPFTATGSAIKYVHQVQLSDRQVRPGLDKVCIVITDGNSQLHNQTKNAAAAARQDGIKMFAVGVGMAVKDSELFNIAGDESRLTRVDNFKKLETIRESLQRQTCVKVLPSTTPLPQTQSCGEAYPADVNFIFSPKSLGPDGTAWAASFVSAVVSQDPVETGYQYGIVSGSCPDDEGFKLNRYRTSAGVQSHLQKYQTPMLTSLVRAARAEGFTSDSGARHGARKIAVLVVGPYGGEDEKDLNGEVTALVNSGVEVFVADPFHSGVRLAGAEMLEGRSSRQAAEDLLTNLCPQG